MVLLTNLFIIERATVYEEKTAAFSYRRSLDKESVGRAAVKPKRRLNRGGLVQRLDYHGFLFSPDFSGNHENDYNGQYTHHG